MHKRLVVALATVTLGLSAAAVPALTLAGPASAAQQGTPAVSGSRHNAFVSHRDALIREQRLYGYLPRPPMPPGLANRPGTPAAPPAASVGDGRTPVAGPTWAGVRDTRYAPGDPTDAVGPSSYIAMVNTMMAIYSRSGTLVTSASANVLTPGVSANDLADPQVMWDPATNRFYYSMIDVPAGKIELGFSKSANPTSIPGSFCDYLMDFGYGAALPDYQKLGSTTHDLLIGANVFPNDPNAAIHADVAWMSKPAGTGTITTCPAQSSFKTGKETNLLDHSLAGQGWTPIPAQQADPSTTGWVVAEPIDPGIDSKGIIDLYKATENADGTVSIQKTATTVTVPFYDDPSTVPAEQAGTSDTLDPLDSRFTHAVSATDPDHGGAMAVWTAHTVLDGSATSGTSEVRWYEINVAGHSVFQSGTITNPGGWAFNGVVSPDRTVNVSGAAHGGDMVLNFNTSSASQPVAVDMVSKIGSQPVSGVVKLFTSPGPDQGLDCVALGGACRWGDYAGAVPDPAASLTAATGRVWLSQMTSTGGGVSSTKGEWSTFDWAATP
ncbi:MAG TPA: hypothetical protein VGS19_17720 [Streptosporangiaceae bacterium]|nr:hypothetical protein [Streptosporangiaceae bacterium]